MLSRGAARSFLASRNGAAATILAITLPVLVGVTGLGFDVGWWYFTKRNFQGAADAAAISAAIALAAGNTGGYATEAYAVAAQHGAVNGQNGLTVNVYYPLKNDPNASTSDPYYNNPDTVEVVIKQTQSAMLAKALGQGNVTIGSRSVALTSQNTYCMLALNNGNVTGIDLSLFLSVVQFNNCSIGVNSTGSSAFTLTGALVLNFSAYTATVAGGFSDTCFVCATPNWTHPIKTNAGAPYTPIADPYASVAVPTGSPPSSALSITSHSACNPQTSPGTIRPGQNILTLNSSTCYGPINVGSGSAVTVNVTGVTPVRINGISVSGAGALTLSTANYTIVGNSNPGISVSNGSITLNAGSGTTYIQGASSNPAIKVSGGNLTINGSAGGTIDILGGSGNPAVSVTNGTTTMNTTSTSTNNILGALGQPAITVGSGGTSGTFTLYDGNSNIQAGCNAPPPASCITPSTITLAGSGNFITHDNTNSTGVVIGPPTPSTYAITVATSNTSCGLGFACGRDLTLGAGTYTIMGGIEVTGGNLTLNPTGTSIGTYIIDGGGGSCGGSGSNVGLCMTFGALNGQNGTILLTGPAGSFAPTFDTPQGLSVDGINLTAPQTGATAGLAVFQNRNNPGGTPPGNTAVGASFLNVTGALYFPAQSLNFVGVTADLSNVCLQLIADTISISGLAWVNDTCPAGVSPIVGVGSGNGSLVE